MLRLLARLAPVLRLARVTTAFAAVSNVWFVILWTRANFPEDRHESLVVLPLWLALTGGALVAVGLYAFGAALNDILDMRRDRAFRPDRPLPSGEVTLETAVWVVAGTLLLALLGATALGITAVLMTLVIAGGILFFNAMARFVPSIGLVFLGLLYAGHMSIPNPFLIFTLPVWLVMTHCLAVGAAVHVVGRRRPRLTKSAVIASVTGWVFWSCVIIGIGLWRAEGSWPGWVSPWTVVGPAALACIFVVMALHKARRAKNDAMAAEKLSRYGALWLALYNGAWMLGQSEFEEASILGLLAVAGFVGMTILRELYGIVEKPLGYRRA